MIADRINVAIAILGLIVMASVTAHEMGRAQGRQEANYRLWDVPPGKSSCRVYPDGGKVCRPYAGTMGRSRLEWARTFYFQKRLEAVK